MTVRTLTGETRELRVGASLLGVAIVAACFDETDTRKPEFLTWLHETILPRMLPADCAPKGLNPE